jgi:Pvc16 N-terminal domain
MATYHAIAATGEAILGLLEAARPQPEFANAQFALYQSTNFQNPMEEGISLYLYRVATNTTRRNLPPSIGPDGRRYRPPLPLDLHYLLTPWARTAAKQQRLLGWSMRALEDTPILPVGLLNHYGTEPETFFPHETVELVCEPLSLQEIVNIWDAFKPNLQLSAAYVARMVAIDTAVEISERSPAQTRVFDFEAMEI